MPADLITENIQFASLLLTTILSTMDLFLTVAVDANRLNPSTSIIGMSIGILGFWAVLRRGWSSDATHGRYTIMALCRPFHY